MSIDAHGRLESRIEKVFVDSFHQLFIVTGQGFRGDSLALIPFSKVEEEGKLTEMVSMAQDYKSGDISLEIGNDTLRYGDMFTGMVTDISFYALDESVQSKLIAGKENSLRQLIHKLTPQRRTL
jgi:hypothetical protein